MGSRIRDGGEGRGMASMMRTESGDEQLDVKKNVESKIKYIKN